MMPKFGIWYNYDITLRQKGRYVENIGVNGDYECQRDDLSVREILWKLKFPLKHIHDRVLTVKREG